MNRLNRAKQIRGWMSDVELQWLSDQSEGKSLVIEFGSWYGRSTAALLGAEKIICVDHWQGDPKIKGDWKPPLEEFSREFSQELADGKIKIETGNTLDKSFAESLIAKYAGRADMVFIDACHESEGIKNDIQLARKLLKSDGLLCGHDYSPGWSALMQVVNEEINPLLVVGTIWNQVRTSRETMKSDMPPIYVIVCEEMGERIAEVKEHLDNLGLDYSFFPGIHGKTWGLQGRRLAPGQTGLQLTHWWLWRFLETRPKEENEWIIFEDDVLLPHDFSKVFPKFRQKLSADTQLVFLGHYQTGETIKLPNGELYTGCQTHAYLVRRSALPVLIETNKQTDWATDMNIAMLALPRLKWHCCYPSMARQKTIEGTWKGSMVEHSASPVRRPPQRPPQIHERGYWIDAGEGHYDFEESLAIELTGLFAGRSVCDLGCGNGSYVKLLRSFGIVCDGFDGTPKVRDYGPFLYVADLSTPVNLGRYDWVLSLEVGEHIPAIYESVFLDNIHRHNSVGVVMSWAVPGQGGQGHVNERPNHYIAQKMASLGYWRDVQSENILRMVSTKFSYFKDTLMVYRRK